MVLSISGVSLELVYSFLGSEVILLLLMSVNSATLKKIPLTNEIWSMTIKHVFFLNIFTCVLLHVMWCPQPGPTNEYIP